MPVVEFALDLTTQYRIQVHQSSEQPSPVTVLLNGSILGNLDPAEQIMGKDFRLPDNSLLNVRIVNAQPQVSRGGIPLYPIDATTANVDVSPAAEAQQRNKKLGGCLVTWLVLNLVVIGGLTLLYFLAIFGATALGTSPLPFLLFGLIGIMGLVGISLIFFWKKVGFYLMVGYVALGLLLSIPFGMLNVRSFIPPLAVVILFVYLNRSDIWQKMS